MTIPDRALTADQVRGALVNAGYRVNPAYTWDWTSPPVTSIQANDTNGRILMILVYPSVATAQAARLRAQTNERGIDANPSSSAGAGPHIVVGYGPSVWNSNVALVQTTQSQLDLLNQAQFDCDNGVYRESDIAMDSSLPDFAVDVDFQWALQNGVSNF